MFRILTLSLAFMMAAVPSFALDLMGQIQAGNVEIVEVTGNGSSSGMALEAVIRNTTSSPIQIDVYLLDPAYFENFGTSQNMIATQIYGAGGTYQVLDSRSFVEIAPNISIEAVLIAYCADFELNNPSASDRFAVDAVPADLDSAARRVVAFEAANPQLDTTIASQLAIWLARGVSPDAIQQQFSYGMADLDLAREILR